MIHVGIRSAWVALMVAVALTPAAASADEIQVTMEASRVSLTATNAPLTDVLAEWARVGATEFIDADKLAAAPVTLELIDVAESDALRILLCPVTGYLAARRAAGAPEPATLRHRYTRTQIRRANARARCGADRRRSVAGDHSGRSGVARAASTAPAGTR